VHPLKGIVEWMLHAHAQQCSLFCVGIDLDTDGGVVWLHTIKAVTTKPDAEEG
jgi:hypothetical protein